MGVAGFGEGDGRSFGVHDQAAAVEADFIESGPEYAEVVGFRCGGGYFGLSDGEKTLAEGIYFNVAVFEALKDLGKKEAKFILLVLMKMEKKVE